MTSHSSQSSHFIKKSEELREFEVEYAFQIEPYYFMTEYDMIPLFYARQKCKNNAFCYFYTDQKRKKYGEAKGYDSFGNISFQFHYHANQIHGTFRSYHPNGNQHIVAHFQNGKLEGALYEYDEDGTLYSYEEYTKNQLNGTSMIYTYEQKILLTFESNRLKRVSGYDLQNDRCYFSTEIPETESNLFYQNTNQKEALYQKSVIQRLLPYWVEPEEKRIKKSTNPILIQKENPILIQKEKRKYIKSGKYKKNV